MSLISDIEKINFKTTAIFFFFVFMISPGILYFYLLRKDLLIALDVVKLVLVSISLICPWFILNFIGITTQREFLKKNKDDKDIILCFAIATLFSFGFLLIAIILWYKFSGFLLRFEIIKFSGCIDLIILFEILFCLSLITEVILEKYKKH